MQITVTIEEIRKHENSVIHHYSRRAEQAVKWLMDHQTEVSLYSRHELPMKLERMYTYLAEWDAKNPAPKLIPSV